MIWESLGTAIIKAFGLGAYKLKVGEGLTGVLGLGLQGCWGFRVAGVQGFRGLGV